MRDERTDAFERVLRQKHLTPFVPELVHPNFRDLSLEILNSERLWLNRKLTQQHIRQPDIVYGFYESLSEFQAYAIETKTDSPGFIAVSFACPLYLTCFFHAIAAHPHFFQEIGNPEREHALRKREEDTLIFAVDQERYRLGITLTYMALRFLTAHEMIHILHGHLRLRLSQTTQEVSSVTEACHGLSTEEALISQTFEVDADSSAILECLTEQLIPQYGPFQQMPGPMLVPSKEALHLWLFALYSLFRLMEDQRTTIPLDKASHPRPMQRLKLIYLTIDLFLERARLDHLQRPLLQAFVAAVDEGEQAFAYFHNSRRNLEPFKEALNDENYSDPLRECWSTLRAQLEPFSRRRGNLPSIPQD